MSKAKLHTALKTRYLRKKFHRKLIFLNNNLKFGIIGIKYRIFRKYKKNNYIFVVQFINDS